jgi:hypothetical protein
MADLLEISEREYIQIEGGAKPKTDLSTQLGNLGISLEALDDYP